MKSLIVILICGLNISLSLGSSSNLGTTDTEVVVQSQRHDLEPPKEELMKYPTDLEPAVPKKSCRAAKPPSAPKAPALCGNKNRDDDRCLFGCIAGGFYNGYCSKSNECYCYHRGNPEKGFIIERRYPVMRKVTAKNSSEDEVSSKSDETGSTKEITLVTDDYTSGYVDVDVNINLEWDLTYLSEWFQSFNFYNNLKCDPCLCPAGCAIYGYFSGFCTPQPASECMCASAAKKPAVVVA